MAGPAATFPGGPRARQPANRLRPGVFIALLSLAIIGPAKAQVLAESAGAGLSRFQRTLNYLQDSPAAEQADFAVTALAELAAVYMAEADLARSEAAQKTGSGRARLVGWSYAVDQYADQLVALLEDVEHGVPVSLRSVEQGPALVTVADRVVILGHPRADQQAAFEQRVLADFCSSHECGRMTAPGGSREPIPVTVMRVNPLWTFAESGPVCANDGLEVSFHMSRDIGTLRGICEELAQELAALATDLAGQRRYGVAIDWDGLAVTAIPGRPEHLVRLNAAGDSALLTLPLLFGSPNLLADIKPWLVARVLGDPAPTIRLSAADYGWQAQDR